MRNTFICIRHHQYTKNRKKRGHINTEEVFKYLNYILKVIANRGKAFQQ